MTRSVIFQHLNAPLAVSIAWYKTGSVMGVKRNGRCSNEKILQSKNIFQPFTSNLLTSGYGDIAELSELIFTPYSGLPITRCILLYIYHRFHVPVRVITHNFHFINPIWLPSKNYPKHIAPLFYRPPASLQRSRLSPPLNRLQGVLQPAF